MSIQRAEELKKEWTGKYVSVRKGVPELRRFEGLVGCVKTVNMNCRLLVQFDTPADISWYDIAPNYLTVVSSPEIPIDADAVTTVESSAKGTDAVQSVAAKTVVQNPLDVIRQQKSRGDANAVSSAQTTSPLDQIRKQSSAVDSRTASEPTKSASAVVDPLAAIRMQAGQRNPTEESKDSPDTETSQKASTTGLGTSTGSPLDRIRAQNSNGKTSLRPVATAAGKSEEIAQDTAATSELVDSAADAVVKPDPPAVSSAPAPIGQAPADVTLAVAGNPLDQIRTQALIDSGTSWSTDSRYEQVQRQAESDQSVDSGVQPNSHLTADSEFPAAGGTPTQQTLFDANLSTNDSGTDADVVGDEDPVKITFHGKKLPQLDDLKIIEGIGPKISELLNANGIVTWAQLSDADPDRLRKILEDAGPRFRMHDPETWPAQARLADSGRWQELEVYQDHLDGGREPG